MAARADLSPPEIINLRRLRGADLSPLLAEEATVWRRALHWDFEPSADLVCRYLDMHALSGFALWANQRIAGYCYYVVDEAKALVGDLFVSDPEAVPDAEHQLLHTVLSDIMSSRRITRVEAQLMMLRRPIDLARLRSVFPQVAVETFPRHLLLARLPAAASGAAFHDITFSAWSESFSSLAARLISACYQGHTDSRINDQYSEQTGAMRFLANIVQYPGCGVFYEPASIVAFDRPTGTLVGLSLASRVGTTTGHVTQICVAPWAQRRGIGRELMLRSLDGLARGGCNEASLTVTAANTPAVEMYQQMGFQTLRDFSAYVWQR